MREQTIILQSSDGHDFEVPIDAAKIADLVQDSVGVAEEDEADDDDGMPSGSLSILRVKKDCLQKVVDYMKHYKEEPMRDILTPLGGNTFDEVMTQEWYQQFVADENMSQEMLFEVLTAANYMGIKPLLDLACLKVTFQLNGKNAEEIRQILNLPELSPEEEAQAREEHRWIFEDSYP